MKRTIIALCALLALVGAAHAVGLGLGNHFGRLGAISGKAGSVVPPTTNFRITDAGAFRITDTAASRIIAP